MLQKDLKNNALVIGHKGSLGRLNFFTHSVNWISGAAPKEPISTEIKIRYKSRPATGLVEPLDNQRTNVILDEPLPDITPGQAGVFYQGQVCLGGGTISLEES